MRELLNSALDRLGIEADRSTTLKRFLATHPIDLVIDAGANLGQFGEKIRRKGYQGRIISFEPVGYVFEALNAKIAGDPLWTAKRLALGSRRDTLPLNVSANHTLSSFLPGSAMLTEYNHHSAASVTEIVPVERLDDVLATNPAKSIFLKADVQGFEREVLEGAAETLKRTHAVYLELPIEHLYEGGWTFSEAIRFMESRGFTPAQFRTVNPLPHDRASAVEFDCLFRRVS